MIVSTSHRFIFVHVPKTAGSSMHRTIEPLAVARPARRSLGASILRRLPLRQAPDTAHFRLHDTAAKIRAKYGPEVYDGFLSFAVVRNPFDHAVSCYEYMKQYRVPRIAAAHARMSFADYLRHRLAPRRPWERVFERLPDQSFFLVDRAERMLVKRVLRFETLAADYSALAADLDLPAPEMQRRNITKGRSDHRPYQSYYDADTVDLVQRLYARDFRLLDYDRDLPPVAG